MLGLEKLNRMLLNRVKSTKRNEELVAYEPCQEEIIGILCRSTSEDLARKLHLLVLRLDAIFDYTKAEKHYYSTDLR